MVAIRYIRYEKLEKGIKYFRIHAFLRARRQDKAQQAIVASS